MSKTIALQYIIFNLVSLILSLLFTEIAYLFIIFATLINLLIFRTYDQVQKRHYQQTFKAFVDQSKAQDKTYQIQSTQMSTIVSNLPFPLALVDIKGNFIIQNDKFKTLCQLEEYLSHYDQVGLDPELRNFMRQATLLETALTKSLTIHKLNYQAISVPVYDEQTYRGCLWMFLDVTQLLDGERMQKRFIADASHELKTPLSSILGMVQILNRQEFNDASTLNEFLIQIEHESLRMDHILKDLLMLSKLASSQMVIHEEEFNVLDLVMGSYQTLKQALLAQNNQFNVDIDPHLIIRADREKFHQVLTNLISNAIKFTQNGKIQVSAELTQQHFILRVEDTGCGIDKADQAHIFDRFFRSEPSRARSLGGSGLGLAIVKSIVNVHLGEITVESHKDQGSHFIMTFPKEIVNKS